MPILVTLVEIAFMFAGFSHDLNYSCGRKATTSAILFLILRYM